MTDTVRRSSADVSPVSQGRGSYVPDVDVLRHRRSRVPGVRDQIHKSLNTTRQHAGYSVRQNTASPSWLLNKSVNNVRFC